MRAHGVLLPGVGRRFELETRDGRRIGVVAYHCGRRDLQVYDAAVDPDAAHRVAVLTPGQSQQLAEFLSLDRAGQPVAARVP